MKFIIVKRGKTATLQRLIDKFVDDLNVRVIWDRRAKDRRQRGQSPSAERRRKERRRLIKSFEGRDYIVIHVVEI
jgi:hypothetical protein